MTTDASGTKPPAYLMGRSEAETRRLMAQHQLYSRFTRRLLEDAGIAEGMKVLDIGSGAGDVALLAAELVGPTGSVVGVELDPDLLAVARERARRAGLTNVTFYLGDAADTVPDQCFDALIGRWILVFLPDPVAALRRW